MSQLLNSNNSYNDLSLIFNRGIDKNELKTVTKELCRSYKKGMISEETFHEIIEHLLAFFIERSVDDKLFSKNRSFDSKLNKLNLL